MAVAVFCSKTRRGDRHEESRSKLIEVSYYDPDKQVRLSVLADTIVLDRSANGSVISAIRFGGYLERAQGLSDTIFGGGTNEAKFRFRARQRIHWMALQTSIP